MLQQQEFQQQMGRIEALVQVFETLPDPDLQAQARELVQALLDLHGAALDRVLELTVASGAQGAALLDTFSSDDLVSKLLILHGIHPLSLEERVCQALTKVKPHLAQHGGSVELLEVSDAGVVRLRLEGSCHGCPSSRVTLKYAIEDGIYSAAPDVTAIEVEGATTEPPLSEPGFVPLSSVAMAAAPLECPSALRAATTAQAAVTS